MASDLATSERTPLPAVPTAATRPHPHRPRLLLLYAGLAAVLGAAIVGVVVYAGRSISPSPGWSSWQPAGSTSTRTSEISQHVAAGYRLPDGKQLLDVYPKALTAPFQTSGSATQDLPIAAVAILGKSGNPDQITGVSDSDSRLFQLCGTGSGCSIGEGTATVERGRLVRREALELALYTFKYVPGVKHVIAFMPPPPGSQPTLVTYFEKSDLKAELSRPLADTLAKKAPLSTAITAQETATIDRLTQARVFSYKFQPTQLGQAVLILSTKI